MGFLKRWSSNLSSMGDSATSNEKASVSTPDSLRSSFDEPPTLPPVELVGYSPSTHQRLLTPELAGDIRGLVPTRLGLYSQWTLVYSLEQHGASLATLYALSQPPTDRRCGFVLVVRDMAGGVFGAYANEPYKPTREGRRFAGNGECFLWKAGPGSSGDVSDDTGDGLRFQAFPHTGVNDFNIYCTQRFLSMGGGDGHYGLWLDDNLDHGVSSRCLTYGNEPLSASPGGKFRIQAVELWRIGG